MVYKLKTQKRRKIFTKRNKKSLKNIKGGGKSNKINNNEIIECIICNNDLNINIGISTFPIGICVNNHKYHLHCVTKWIQSCYERGVDYTCPICMQLITDDRILSKFGVYSEKAKEIEDCVINNKCNLLSEEEYHSDFDE